MPTPFDIQMLVDGMETDLWASETAYDSYYDQPNGDGTRLEGIASIGVPWLAEVVIQHVWNSYLKLLNAPPIEASLFVGPRALLKGPVLARPTAQKKQIFPLGRHIQGAAASSRLRR
jgi:hypothetical protein